MMILLIFLSQFLYSEVGIVNRVIGEDAVIVRENGNQIISEGTLLEEGDEIQTNNSTILFQIYPATQVTLSKESYFLVDEHDFEISENKENSKLIVTFLKGKLKILVDKLSESDTTEQIINTKSASFAVRGTEFEILEDDEGTSIDVNEGKVEARTELERIDLFKEESVRVQRGSKGRLRERVLRGRKFSKERWSFGFIDRNRVKERWKSRRFELREKFKKNDRGERLKKREERQKRRERPKDRNRDSIRERRRNRDN